MTVYEKLMEVKDDKYKDFQAKLVPNISPDTIIGVRTPQMRSVAKEVFASGDSDAFLSELPHKYYEENLVHFFILAMIKDFDECVRRVEEFLPYVDCWPVSDHVYTARFGIRMLMNEFLGEDFKDEYAELVASKRSDDYYLKMMVAWYFATALAKNYDETVKYIEERRLDEWVHKKAIQKAVESFRVSDEHKEYLKEFR